MIPTQKNDGDEQTKKDKEVKLIKIELTPREVQIIKVMRRKPFGTYVIKKFGGVLVRIESQESFLLKDDEDSINEASISE